MFGLGVPEIVVLLVLGLLLFGKSLPTAARSLGRSVASFRQEINGISESLEGPGK
jgi:sec-independent protein translocase protein TatA